jgi:hypothetical protein
MKLTLVNLVLFHIGWFASVLGAANGLPWIGIAVVTVLILVHLSLMRFRTGEFILVTSALGIGWVCDSAIVLLGGLSFPTHAQLGGPTTSWMAFMWANFATTLNTSLKWLHGRWVLVAAFGVIGGPASYYSGMKLGAVILPEPLWSSLLLIGVMWAIASPMLIWLASQCIGIDVSEPRASCANDTRGEVMP